MLTEDLQILARRNGVEVIGAAQRVIAYASIADGGNGTILITAAAHGLKKTQSIYIATGTDYVGSYRVKEVVSANVIRVVATFTVTRAGNINLTSCVEGHGFFVNKIAGPLVIQEFVPDDPNFDVVAFKAKVFVDNEVVPIPFSLLRISGGDVTAVKRNPRASLTYSNR